MAASAADMSAAKPLVGRDKELGFIDELISSIARGPRFVVVRGPAGIGKTELWRSALQRSRDAGRRVLITRPAEEELAGPMLGLVDLFEDAEPDPNVLAAEVDRYERGRAVLATLRRLVAEGPLVLAIDDVQWLSSSRSRPAKGESTVAPSDRTVMRPDSSEAIRYRHRPVIVVTARWPRIPTSPSIKRTCSPTGSTGRRPEDHRLWRLAARTWRDGTMTKSSATPVVPRVDDLGLRPVVVVAPGASLGQAARIMRAHDISALVVGAPGELVSIVTERDLTQALADARPSDAAVEAIASPEPLTVSPEATVMDAATVMLRAGIRHLVVTKGRRAVGVVSMRDVLTALIQAVTPDAVVVMLEQLRLDPPELWLG